jgi:hypothetical protein
MLKKTAAIFLCVMLLAAMAVPALAAADSLNEQLARVTQTVKETLNIDNSYTSSTES